MATREIYIGQNHQYVAIVRNGDGKILHVPVTWASDNIDIVRIDNQGLAVAGPTAGSAQITGAVGALTSAADTVINLGPVPVGPSHSLVPGLGLPSGPPPTTFPPRTPSGPLDTNPSIPPPVTIFLGPPDAATPEPPPFTIFLGPPDAGQPQPPPLTIFDGGSGTGGNYVRESFESGAYGPKFSNPFTFDIDVIADPTSRASGKVARMFYHNNPPIQPDANRALLLSGLTRNNDTVLWFQGEFYIDSTNDTSRQLVLFNASTGYMQVIFSLEPFASGLGQPTITINGFGSVSTPIGSPITLQAWHTVKMHVQVNTVPSISDGTVEVWINNAQIYSNTAVAWDSPLLFDEFGVGYNLSDSSTLTEYRYWDNLSYAFLESGL